MAKPSILSVVAIVFALGSLIFFYFDQQVIASSFGLVAYFVSMFAVKAGSMKWIVWVQLLVSLAFGYVLCPKGGLFCMAACIVFLSLIGNLRLILFEKLTYARLNWLEPLFLVVAVGYYIIGNIYDGAGWLSWAYPAPVMAMGGFMIMGKIIEGKELAANAIRNYAVDIGEPAPGFSLPDEEGNMVDLSDFKGKRYVLLIFVRGDWCPTCHIMLRSYEKNKERFAEKNIMLLAIGPDDISVNKAMVEKLNLDYKLLSDTHLTAAKAYGMQIHSNNPMTKYAEGIPLPASFLVDIDGTLLYTSNPKNAGQILNPETIFPVIDKIRATA